jgi:hypothetical protein
MEKLHHVQRLGDLGDLLLEGLLALVQALVHEAVLPVLCSSHQRAEMEIREKTPYASASWKLRRTDSTVRSGACTYSCTFVCWQKMSRYLGFFLFGISYNKRCFGDTTWVLFFAARRRRRRRARHTFRER